MWHSVLLLLLLLLRFRIETPLAVVYPVQPSGVDVCCVVVTLLLMISAMMMMMMFGRNVDFMIITDARWWSERLKCSERRWLSFIHLMSSAVEQIMYRVVYLLTMSIESANDDGQWSFVCITMNDSCTEPPVSFNFVHVLSLYLSLYVCVCACGCVYVCACV